MTRITAYDALNALDTVVTARGRDFVYQKSDGVPACTYIRNELPDCGVGRALSLLGVPNHILAQMDRLGDTSIQATDRFLAAHGFELTESAVSILSDFQFSQDSQCTYGACIDTVYRHRVQREMAVIRGTK
jgi:hypothetical protein